MATRMSISLPDGLADELDEYLDDNVTWRGSRSKFVAEAIREKLEAERGNVNQPTVELLPSA